MSGGLAFGTEGGTDLSGNSGTSTHNPNSNQFNCDKSLDK
jgi:hypothetical protein